MNPQPEGDRAPATGASSGTGASITKTPAEKGALVVGHGRDRERAEGVAREIREPL